MIPKLEDYRKIVGKEVLDNIKSSAETLKGRHIVHVNSTSQGGGVAEILNSIVFLMNDLGIKTGWRTILGSHSFFKITKGMHNSLQGGKFALSENRKKIYSEYCTRNSIINHMQDHDLVVVHDPQPLGMIKGYEKMSKWLWRCHIDLSSPNKETLNYLLSFIKRYDGVIVSSKKFRIKRLKIPQHIIPPSIDPLSTKNKNMSHHKARNLLALKGIDVDKPIITQISRFDPWKNPFGVIKMYQKVREQTDCQLVLMGDMATDDPQGPIMYHAVKQKSQEIPNMTIITEKNDLLVNALQQEAAIVFQNSIREGFALTVSEAMWKKTPVIGTNVGGIPLQIINKKTGFIIKNVNQGVKRTLQLMKDEELRIKMGEQAHEHVKKNFLITRHLHDYINTFNRTLFPESFK